MIFYLSDCTAVPDVSCARCLLRSPVADVSSARSCLCSAVLLASCPFFLALQNSDFIILAFKVQMSDFRFGM